METMICTKCNGSGFVSRVERIHIERADSQFKFSALSVEAETCSECDGIGQVPVRRRKSLDGTR